MSRKFKILIVDDIPDNLTALETLLEGFDVDIIKAYSGNEAVRLAFENDFTLIIMDIQMPEMNGFEAVRLIKKEEKNRDIPIIFLTAAYTDDISQIEGIKAGAVDFLVKPVNHQYMEGKIKQFLEIQKGKERLKEMLFRDYLTGAINRKPFNDLLETKIQDMKRKNGKLAVLFFDLERFKQINDNYGHDIGDKVLKIAAEKIKSNIRRNDLLGRIGGDEFIACLDNIKSVDNAVKIAEKINHAFIDKINVDGLFLDLTVSIGISVYPDDGEDDEGLLKASDIAMYKAKQSKRNTYRVYDKKHEKESFLEQALMNAFDNDEFSLHYQPAVDKNGKFVFIEALCRWENPDFDVSPNVFIPLLEKNNEINRVGQWILNEACGKISTLNEKPDYADLAVSVNLSEIQLNDDDFLNEFDRIMKVNCVNTENLVLEITEKGEKQNYSKLKGKLNEFKKLNRGGRLALDDFGTGYSSISNLIHLPVDIVKIDKYIIDNLNSEKFCEIAPALIQLVRKLGFKAVAEGVETKKQFEQLEAAGCDYFQGYYFSEPVEDIEKILP